MLLRETPPENSRLFMVFHNSTSNTIYLKEKDCLKKYNLDKHLRINRSRDILINWQTSEINVSFPEGLYLGLGMTSMRSKLKWAFPLKNTIKLRKFL
jgi:hypothetical protein